MIDARTFIVSLGGVHVEIARVQPILSPSSARDIEAGVCVLLLGWTATVVGVGERVVIAHRSGGAFSPNGRHTSESIDRFALEALLEEVRWKIDAVARLTVMAERAMHGEVSDKPGMPFAAPMIDMRVRKVRKLAEAGSARLAAFDISWSSNAGLVVFGDVAFIVSRRIAGRVDDKNVYVVEERLYQVGDLAVYGSYNLSYMGTITAIGPKAIKVQESSGSMHVMKHDRFVSYNSSSIESAQRRNQEWSD